MAALSDKPEWVRFESKGDKEVYVECERCGKGRTFDGDLPIERGVKYAIQAHGNCKEETP